MLRVLLTIVLPLLLPTALYLAWIRTMQGAERDATRWRALPWVWLVGAGTLLLIVVLVIVNWPFGRSESGIYVPPRWENGRIVPGHIEICPACGVRCAVRWVSSTDMPWGWSISGTKT